MNTKDRQEIVEEIEGKEKTFEEYQENRDCPDGCQFCISDENCYNYYLKDRKRKVELYNKIITLTEQLKDKEIQKTKDEIFMKLESMLIDDLDYPQRNYAYLLHKKDFNRLKQSVK